MSANNWSECPKCRDNAEKAQAKALAKAEAGYGKLKSEKYLELMREVAAEIELDQTLREDYFQGVRDGAYRVSYHCMCQKCGFTFEYKHEQDVPLNVKEKP